MSKSLFKKFSSKARGAFGAPKTTRRQRTRLGVESLESRQLFSTAIVGGDSFTQGQIGQRSILGIAPGSSPADTGTLPTTAASDQGHIYQLTGSTIQVAATSPKDTFGIVFFDADHGGVLVEFAGQGTVTVSLDTTLPSFVLGGTAGFVSSQGLASINVDGASTNVLFPGIATNGTIRISEINNAYDTDPVPAAGVIPTTNGVANIRSLSFSNTPTFGGILAAGADFAANSGTVGILAAQTSVTGPVRIGNINAGGTATPTLAFGFNSTFANVEVYGGDLINDNGSVFNVGSNPYGYGILGLPGNFTNELGVNFSFDTNTNLTNAASEFPGAAISLPRADLSFTITDATTQTDVDTFFNGREFGSSFTLDIDTTDGTTHGLTVGDGATAFDGTLNILVDPTSTAVRGTFDGSLEVARLGAVNIGSSTKSVDLLGAVETNNAPGGGFGRIGAVTVNGNVGAGGGIEGGTIASILVTGDVTGGAAAFSFGSPAKFETTSFQTGPATLGQITINGDVSLAGAGDVLVDVGDLAFGAGGSAIGGALRGLTVLGGGVAGDAVHNLGSIVFPEGTPVGAGSVAPGAINITDNALATDFGGVQSGFFLGGGSSRLGSTTVTASGDLTLSGAIGNFGGFGGSLGTVSLNAGGDLNLNAEIGQNITTFTAATATDGATGVTPTSGLILTAGGDVNGGGFNLLGTVTSLPSVYVNAGGDINLGGSLLGSDATSFGKIYMTAGGTLTTPYILEGVGGAATARGTTDILLTAGDDVNIPGGIGNAAFGEVNVYNNITITTGNADDANTGGDVNLNHIVGASAKTITINVDSAGDNAGSITFNAGSIAFAGTITSFNVLAGGVQNAAGTGAGNIFFEGGGDVVASSFGSITLGLSGTGAAGTNYTANIEFDNGATTTAATAFILADDGTAKIDTIGSLNLGGVLDNFSSATYPVQAGRIGDIAINTDLTTSTFTSAVFNFGVLANNYRATRGDVDAFGGTNETLGGASLSKLTQYTLGSVTISTGGTGLATMGHSVFGGNNTFMGAGGIKSATTGEGVFINSGSNDVNLFAGGADAYFMAGNANNDARGGTAGYSLDGAAAPTTAGITSAPIVAIGNVDVHAAGTGSTITNLSNTGGGSGLSILAGVHDNAANAPLTGSGGAFLTQADTPVDDLPGATPSATPLLGGTIGNVNLSTYAAGALNGGLLTTSASTPTPINNNFSTSMAAGYGIIAATTSIGEVNGIAGLVFPTTLNGNNAVQVGQENMVNQEIFDSSILVYLV